MSMYGVPTYLNLLSWMISGIIFNVILIILTMVLFKVWPGKLNGNMFLFFIMVFLTFASVISYGIHVSSYFSRSKSFYNLFPNHATRLIKQNFLSSLGRKYVPPRQRKRKHIICSLLYIARYSQLFTTYDKTFHFIIVVMKQLVSLSLQADEIN